MLQYKVVDGPTLDILIKLNNSDLFKNYRLVGGTALALIQGHRKSIDLDFFGIEKIDSDELITFLKSKPETILAMNLLSFRIHLKSFHPGTEQTGLILSTLFLL